VLVSLVASAASAADERAPSGKTTGAGGAAGRASTRPRPIVDTHIHFYKVSRPGGVPWPSLGQKLLYRDVLPEEYKALARRHGIVASGIVEASPKFEDNRFVLDLVKGDPFFPFFVAQIEIGAPDFAKNLAELARDKRVVGVRGFLWGPELSLDPTQIEHLRDLAARGMVLDIISRGTLNPKDKVSALAAAVPTLRIIIDHLGGARGPAPAPEWELAIRRLADRHQNLYVKFSSFYDMYNPGAGEDEPWKAPVDLAAYKAHFEVLMSAFGEDRLVWGSNWPVSDLGGDFGRQIQIAEEFLAPYGPAVRDKVMYRNARALYRRAPAARAR
jgi:predicted TIM-barrel fold metal-dependent hydrolase